MKKIGLANCNSVRTLIRVLALALLLQWLIPAQLSAQFLKGNVYSIGVNGDTVAVYMARLQWKSTAVGTITSTDGSYRLPFANTDTLIVSYSFYKPDTVIISRNERKHNFLINSTQPLKEVVVSKKRNRYVRKGNPAVELVKNVIEHKHDNRIESAETYKLSSYRKLVLSFGKFEMDFQKNWFNRKLSFLEKYIDTSHLDSVSVLTISLREDLKEHYYQQSPRKNVHYVKAKRMRGLDESIDAEGFGNNMDDIFSEVNIFENDIDLLLNHFVSPLSSTLGVTFYHYFITDTIKVDSVSYIELSFTPANSRGYGFTGRMYIVNDSSYALKRYILNVPYNINLNYVNDLVLEQEFVKSDSGFWAPKEAHTYASFSLAKSKRMKKIYAHQATFWRQCETGLVIPDSIADALPGSELVAVNAKKFSNKMWSDMRPIPLSSKEGFLDSLSTEFRRMPFFRVLENVAKIIASGYIATSKDRKLSFFDVGPVYNMLSMNPAEGVRLRVGGMTTAKLHDRWFINGYLAFGCRDLRFKYNLSITHTFDKKEHHVNESPKRGLYFSTGYDVEFPGQKFTYLDHDNLLMSYGIDTLSPAFQYVRRTKLLFRWEWHNTLSVESWVQYENNEAAGSLAYWRVNGEGMAERVHDFYNFEWAAKIRWTPGAKANDNQIGEKRAIRLSKEVPTLSLTHTIGFMDHHFWYNRTDMSIEKRFWFSAFGYLDATLEGGIVWNSVPYPKLYVPNNNQSVFLTPNTFNLMKPMEFLMDKYVALFATYHLKGWIFNRIPYWNRLNLREVISFSGVYGNISPKNIPGPENPGLYLLPDGYGQMGKIPYMEITAGIENILNLIRIDYVRRLSYAKDLKGWGRNGVRVTVEFSF